MTATTLPFNVDTCEQDFAGPGRRVAVTRGRQGFQVKFDNGWVLSVQFGWGHYHSGRDINRTTDYLAEAEPSIDAEVAAWKDGGGMIDLGGDSVAGWQPLSHVQAALEAAARDDVDGIRAALVREG